MRGVLNIKELLEIELLLKAEEIFPKKFFLRSSCTLTFPGPFPQRPHAHPL